MRLRRLREPRHEPGATLFFVTLDVGMMSCRLRDMDTTRQAEKADEIAVFTLRIQRSKLERLRAIAAAQHRSLVQHLRALIDREIAAEDDERTAA